MPLGGLAPSVYTHTVMVRTIVYTGRAMLVWTLGAELFNFSITLSSVVVDASARFLALACFLPCLGIVVYTRGMRRHLISNDHVVYDLLETWIPPEQLRLSRWAAGRLCLRSVRGNLRL
jgi:hypothetical protein